MQSVTEHKSQAAWPLSATPHLTLRVFVIERTEEPASEILINPVKTTRIVVPVPGS